MDLGYENPFEGILLFTTRFIVYTAAQYVLPQLTLFGRNTILNVNHEVKKYKNNDGHHKKSRVYHTGDKV